MIIAAKRTTKPRGRKRRMDPSRAVAYIRVSTEEQENGPAAQADAIALYAAAQGLAIASTHVEIVSGGAELADRPVLWEAIEAAKVARAGVFVVAKRDRLARDIMVSTLLDRELETAGVQIVSADGAGNGASPEAALMRAMLSAIAEYERALIRNRTRAALASRRARGLKTGGSLPFGSALGPDGQTLVPNPAERETIDLVLSWRAAGLGMQAIADRLNTEGIPSRGTRWHLTSVARLLRRECPPA